MLTLRNAAAIALIVALVLLPILAPGLADAASVRLRIRQPGPDAKITIHHPRGKQVTIQSRGVSATWTGRRYADNCGF